MDRAILAFCSTMKMDIPSSLICWINSKFCCTSAGARPIELIQGTVRFEDVSFAYGSDGAPPVLHGISFELERGQTLGVVGPPGSGKSPIAHLIARHYAVSGGRITLDGQDIRDATLDSLRRLVRVVPQDPFLFTSGLDNNIAYGDPWTDDEPIAEAATLAQIDGFIDGLPDGYDTLVGERGVSLSGGQKQRIAIARTAMLAPAVLVLDDSPAAIDAATEGLGLSKVESPAPEAAAVETPETVPSTR